MSSYIFSDIDGVLTDGKVYLDAQGHESKQICYRDLDSIAIGRKAGLEFVLDVQAPWAQSASDRVWLAATTYSIQPAWVGR